MYQCIKITKWQILVIQFDKTGSRMILVLWHNSISNNFSADRKIWNFCSFFYVKYLQKSLWKQQNISSTQLMAFQAHAVVDIFLLVTIFTTSFCCFGHRHFVTKMSSTFVTNITVYCLHIFKNNLSVILTWSMINDFFDDLLCFWYWWQQVGTMKNLFWESF